VTGGMSTPPSPMAYQSRLEVRNLRKSYGSRVVVKDVSLTVDKGEVVGLLGPNGAGKTTSFYMIVGLLRADGGEILLDDRRIEQLPIHRRARLGLGYLPQEASIFRKLTVQENVRAVLELQKDAEGRALTVPEIERRLDQLLKDLRVDHLRDSPAPSLSGGERRRVEIARALATSPRFILLDEPFAGIDPIAVIEIQQIISFLKGRGIGVLITDHNVRETLGICDHAYIISDARSWPAARRPRSSTTRMCVGCISASTSGCDETRTVAAGLAASGAHAPAPAIDPPAAVVHPGDGPGSRADARREPVPGARGRAGRP